MNKERKDLYCRSKKPNNVQKAVLQEVQLYEDQHETDICLWDINMTMDFLKSQKYIFPLDIYIAHQTMRAYVDYCARKGDRCEGGVLEASMDDIIGCLSEEGIRQYYLPRDRYLSLVKAMENPVDQFFLLGLYEGISSTVGNNEMMNVRISDIDGNTLHLPSRDIEISDELKEIMITSEQTFEYHGTREVHLDAKRDYVVKPTYRVNAGFSEIAFTRRIERVIEKFGDRFRLELLTPLKIMEIGRFDFIKRRVNSGEYSLNELFSWSADGKAYLHEKVYGTISRRSMMRKFYERALEI